MSRTRNLTLLLLFLSILLNLGCAKKQAQVQLEVFDHPRDGYSIQVPEGWTTRLRDRVTYSILEILSDTTKVEGEQPEIIVVSDNMRRPMDFKSIVNDAIFKMTVIRTSSHHFELLDSSRVEVKGRQGVSYTYERVPSSADPNSTPRHVVMVFLQVYQGMISIKYIAPKPVAQQYATLFHRNLEGLTIRDIGEAISEEEYEVYRKELHERRRAEIDKQKKEAGRN